MSVSIAAVRGIQLIAISAGAAALIQVCLWVTGANLSQKYLGGLDFAHQTCFWHPVMMVCGMVFCFHCAINSYRLLPFSHTVNKTIHVLFHIASIICIILGMTWRFVSRNVASKNPDDIIISNLNTTHSLIGLGALIIYFQNFIFGGCIFNPLISVSIRAAYKPNHVFFGIFTLISTTAAVISGLTEMFGKLGCQYTVSSADLNPGANYTYLEPGCKLINGVGICTFLAAFCSLYALLHQRLVTVENKVYAAQVDSAPEA